MKNMLAVVLLLFLAAAPVLAGTLAEGQDLYKTRCDLCHQLPDTNLLTSAQWVKVLDSMQTVMKQSGYPQLSKEEYDQVLSYVQANAKDAKTTSNK